MRTLASGAVIAAGNVLTAHNPRPGALCKRPDRSVMLELNPKIDRAALAARFRAEGRVQVPDVLTLASAQAVRAMLLQRTRWELAWQAGEHSTAEIIPHSVLTGVGAQQAAAQVTAATDSAAQVGDYAFRFASYPILTAYLEGRDPGGPHDSLIEAMNTPEMLGLVRDVTGIAELVKADAQATLFLGNHFLGQHTDANKGLGWRIAYVLNLAPDEWHPNWGGYLQFYDEDGNITCGWRPRFNVLNLMAVPCSHAVSYVPPYAPPGRVAITGWFRDS